jgi:hypothetical protein
VRDNKRKRVRKKERKKERKRGRRVLLFFGVVIFDDNYILHLFSPHRNPFPEIQKNKITPTHPSAAFNRPLSLTRSHKGIQLVV